ncbi:MAG: hypothetical protein GEU96_18430 [Propionibacteriales bacterium]|nr:hypothetical protein [Propionibacteriales bacterium]
MFATQGPRTSPSATNHCGCHAKSRDPRRDDLAQPGWGGQGVDRGDGTLRDRGRERADVEFEWPRLAP